MRERLLKLIERQDHLRKYNTITRHILTSRDTLALGHLELVPGTYDSLNK